METTWTTFMLLFTALASFVLIIALPTMLVWGLIQLWRKHNRRPLLRSLFVAGGLAAGIAIAWYIAVAHYGWRLSPVETFYATVHSDIYGHEIEHAAEGFAFFILFLGDIGAITAGIAGWFALKHRPRHVAVAN
jgi:hypothetical protein